MTDTLLVTLYGGPGTGKSTTAALVFGTLKQRGHNVELVHEFAKDLTWEDRQATLAFQPYVTAKQMWWNQRLMGKVDAIITDTSPLLSLVYSDPSPEFKAWLLNEYSKLRTLNIFLQRDPERPYNPSGRSQTQREAEQLDDQIRRMLRDTGTNVLTFDVDKSNNTHVEGIIRNIRASLIEQKVDQKINERLSWVRYFEEGFRG